jgi:sec-independent protein translocase protein TatC
MNSANPAPNPALLRFLVELRRRLIASAVVILILFCVLAYFSNSLYHWLALPLLNHLPQGSYLIATQVIAPLWIPFKFSMIVAVILSVPYIIYQAWAFIAPALYANERRMAWPLLLISILLFYLGMAFAYFVIFPLLFSFLAKSAPQHVMVAPDISQYLDFTMKMLLVFGLVFEVPIVTVVLIMTGITTRERLAQMRPYIIVAAFILGMLFAPPDVFSQTLLAIPLWLLFELGLLSSRFFTRHH